MAFSVDKEKPKEKRKGGHSFLNWEKEGIRQWRDLTIGGRRHDGAGR